MSCPCPQSSTGSSMPGSLQYLIDASERFETERFWWWQWQGQSCKERDRCSSGNLAPRYFSHASHEALWRLVPWINFVQTNLWSTSLQNLYGTCFEACILEWEVLWHLFKWKASRQGLFYFNLAPYWSYVSCLHVTGYSGCILQLGWNQLPWRAWSVTGL